MSRAVWVSLVLWSGSALAASRRVPTDDEVAALRQTYKEAGTVESLLDWADAERERGQCPQRADKLYRHAFYRDDITDEERYRAQIGYERCEDPDHPRRPQDQLRLPPPKLHAKKVAKKRRAPPRPKLVAAPEPEDAPRPGLGWRIAGYTTASLTVLVGGVKLASDNPGERDFVLNSTTGMIAVGAVLSGAFLWRGYSGVAIAPAVTASSGGASAQVSF